ncbi:MAG TPA: OpgC domain-containing protein [Candidatus Babeliales bacterium]|nr:OpgC domain-containing protein [Candidatus Babeliales bacterium]
MTRTADANIKGKSKRILAFDLIRGFFLLVILVDHVELYPNGLDLFTGKGRLWVSAAEGFFFMSGLLIGMIYKRRLALGMKFIFKKMWTRAAELYLVGTGLTLLYLAWAVFTNHPYIKDSLPVPFPWHHYIEQALLMRFTYGWADFLIRFAILMAFAPLVFWLVAKRLWWLALVGIVTVWFFRGQGFTLAWQLIFNSGIIIGFHWQQIQDKFNSFRPKTRGLIKKSFVALTAITFVFSYASVFVLSLLFHLWGWDLLPHWWQHVAFTWGWINHDVWIYADKWTLAPLRVALFFIWFPALYWVVRRFESQINTYTKGIFEILGKNSLYVYTAESFVVFVFKLYVIPPKTNVFQNFLITVASIALVVLMTIGYKRLQPRLNSLKQHQN